MTRWPSAATSACFACSRTSRRTSTSRSGANAETPLLNYLNVRYLVGDRGLDPGDPRRYQLVYDGRDGRIFENRDVKPRFFAAHDIVLEFRHDHFAQTLTEHDFSKQTVVNILPVDSDRMRNDLLAPKSDPIVQIVEAADTNFRLHIRSQRHALIVSSQPWWPGWRVFRNGQRIAPQLGQRRIPRLHDSARRLGHPHRLLPLVVLRRPGRRDRHGAAADRLAIRAIANPPPRMISAIGINERASPGPVASSPMLKLAHSDAASSGA